ncbi:GTP cyclohydrolase II [Rhodotorula toruloides]|uniref:GTP cyclohydrolase II n=1 Tax=Rhodotorula toruloides TaxID=5286 RepID=A0A0K3C9F8_RHOTO|nr:GTP cyclohydrolase II-domain containing protein [Rhodotorula toruloides]
MLAHQQQHAVSQADLSVLSLLTQDQAPSPAQVASSSSARGQPHASTHRSKTKKGDGRADVDPLLIAAAAASGPDVTRNHYFHSFFPHPLAYSACDDERAALNASPPGPSTSPPAQRPKMESRQAPRSIRLQVEEEEKRRLERLERLRREQMQKEEEQKGVLQDKPQAVALPTRDGGFDFQEDGKVQAQASQRDADRIKAPKPGQVRHLQDDSLVVLLRQPSTPPPLEHPLAEPPFPTVGAQSAVKPESPLSAPEPTAAASPEARTPLPPLEVQCRVRTRIPTPHGHIFLHLYTNNHDTKEHLAFVADHAQMASTSLTTNAVEGTPILAETGERRLLPFIRSHSLDCKWHDGETDQERIVRGAYVGRLTETTHIASHPNPHSLDPTATPPHVHRSHRTTHNTSSQAPTDPPLVRIHSECFTGETIGSQRCDCGEQLDEAFRLITLAGRGVIVYLRQEGRGIGLLEKMRAYNLQDLGHDTVTANLMLGHGADMRTYGIAGAILRDLGVAHNGVRLLTNNPDKIKQIEGEGVKVVERVAMVPRSWVLAEEEAAAAARRAARKAKGKVSGGDKRKSLDASIASLQSLDASSRRPSDSRSTSLASSAGPSGYSSRAPSDIDGELSDGDSDSSDWDAKTDSSRAYHLRRAGVGMIGASVTSSPELDKYLRTKIDRMGHLLNHPTQQGTLKRVMSSGGASTPGATHQHPLSESVTSLDGSSGEAASR